MMGVGYGATTVRHGDVRAAASMVKLMEAAQHKKETINPVTVVTEAESNAADNNLGKLLNVKA
jgi:hypothetical protein